MKRTSFSENTCLIAQTLDLIGEWWTPLILRDIFWGIRRFDGLLNHLGVSRNILTDRLRTLVENQILEKRLYQQNPPRYEYGLTERGRDLFSVLLSLMAWGDRWLNTGKKNAVEVVHLDCGQSITPVMSCPHCQTQLTPRSIRMQVRVKRPPEELKALAENTEKRALPPATKRRRNGARNTTHSNNR